jgi:hypothetical protein
MKKKYNYHDRQALAKMTDKEAWEIINNLAELEFPTMFEKGTSFVFRETCAHYFSGLQFALFRVRQLSIPYLHF